jgi:glucose/arabinose dehydrogenase
MIYFTPPNYTDISLNTPIFEDFGRIRTVVQGPDDYLYFCTSNRDGRGNPSERDDMIVRILPP